VSNQVTTNPTTLYGYDAVGNLKSVSDPNGMTTTYSYNDLNELTDEVAKNASNQTLFSEHTDWYADGMKQDVIDKRYDASGTLTSQTTTAWLYDGLDRLTQETLTVQTGTPGTSGVPTAYMDTFSYDLASNRMQEQIDGGSTVSGGSTIAYSYNGDDQLQLQTTTVHGTGTTDQIAYSYDPAGNLASQFNSNGTTDIYSYNLNNQMIQDATFTSGYKVTDYTYDGDGVLAGQVQKVEDENPEPDDDGNVIPALVTISQTHYLNDPNNPTGSTKAIQTSIGLGGTPTTSYVLGLKVEAQRDTTNGTLYLLTDGHNSTRALTTSTGAISTSQLFDYDAFGTAIDFDPTTAKTTWLFGGDGFYDKTNGFTYQLARWRNGFWFTQSDYGREGQGNVNDPLSLQPRMYADGNPINGWDPSGHFGIGEMLSVVSIMSTLDAVVGYTKQVVRIGQDGLILSDLANFMAGVRSDSTYSIEDQLSIRDQATLEATQAIADAVGNGIGIVRDAANAFWMKLAFTGLLTVGSAVVQTAATELHHAFPKYLGGTPSNSSTLGHLVEMTREQHIDLHNQIDAAIQPTRFGTAEVRAQGFSSLAEYWTNQPPSAKIEMLDKLLETTAAFERSKGLSGLVSAAINGIKYSPGFSALLPRLKIP
jgi:YD repeat-containing protein